MNTKLFFPRLLVFNPPLVWYHRKFKGKNWAVKYYIGWFIMTHFCYTLIHEIMLKIIKWRKGQVSKYMRKSSSHRHFDFPWIVHPRYLHITYFHDTFKFIPGFFLPCQYCMTVNWIRPARGSFCWTSGNSWFVKLVYWRKVTVHYIQTG